MNWFFSFRIRFRKGFRKGFSIILRVQSFIFIWVSYDFHMNFIWVSYEFHIHMHFLSICISYSYAFHIHISFIWVSYSYAFLIHMHFIFIWVSYEFHLSFIWVSYEFHIYMSFIFTLVIKIKRCNRHLCYEITYFPHCLKGYKCIAIPLYNLII